MFTPWLWNRLLDYTPQKAAPPVERTHKDGIKVTPDSPEALEEVLWMAFFPGLHDPRQNAALDERTSNPAFERFYRDHIRKLLQVRGGRALPRQGQLQRHPARLSAAAVSRCALRGPGARRRAGTSRP